MASIQKIDLNSKKKEEEESDDEFQDMGTETMNESDDDDDDGEIEVNNDDDNDNDDEEENEDYDYEASENLENLKSDSQYDIYDEEDTDVFDYNDPDTEIKTEKRIPDNERTTIPRLTKYERVRILGTRAKQISDGSKIFIKSNKVKNAMDIAELELEHKVIPLKIKRPLPNGQYEIWSIKELEII